MSAIDENTSIEELAAMVCQKLKDRGIDAFLSGGAVVTIYTKNQFESFDLDFVSIGDRKRIKEVMVDLGFNQSRSRLYEHPKTKYLVEFPGASMAIGDEAITEFSERRIKGKTLKLLTPTDCIKDRLAAYIHWKDPQGLVQAVMVAADQPHKLEQIRSFCKSEGAANVYDEFISKLKAYKNA